jgi:hypothetical protein
MSDSMTVATPKKKKKVEYSKMSCAKSMVNESKIWERLLLMMMLLLMMVLLRFCRMIEMSRHWNRRETWLQNAIGLHLHRHVHFLK